MKKLYVKVLLFSILSLFGITALQAQKTLSVKITNADDDQEEWLAGSNQTKTVGDLDGGSSDLELGNESGLNDPQMVGMRFANITIPKGALITSAYIQFTVDATSKNTDPCVLNITTEDNANPVTFNPTVKFDITSRTKSSQSVVWNVSGASWGTVGAATADQRTPNLNGLLQSLIDNNAWASGNAVAFYITGTGTREVESADGNNPGAATLVVNYIEPKTLSSKITVADDDLEEWLNGANAGNLDAGSSDLELGNESAGTDPQMVGMRFSNINIPKGAVITNAYIQFTVDATSKNTDPCVLTIKAENNDNPVTYNPATKFDITSRPKSADSVMWTVGGTTWGTVGSATADQRTPNLKNLVQALVNRTNWSSNYAMAFYITGTGTREVESSDGNNPGAPTLVVDYIEPTVLTTKVASADDDQEEWLAAANQTKTVGDLDGGSSDLELGTESAGNDPQMVGIRFANIAVPQGAIIQNAYIQFTVDATSKNTDPCVLTIKTENNDNPVTFNPATKFDITNRAKGADSVQWTVSGASWGTVGAATADQRTPNLKNLVQALVNRGGWNSGNAMSFYITGTGTREVESADGNNPGAASLVIEYLGGNGGPSGPKPKIPVTNFPIAKKSNWSYHDSGYIPANNWTAEAYKGDTLWNFGPAVLGYGETVLGTTLKFGPNSNNKYTTAYFRKPFNVASVAALADTLEMNVLADDGFVIYINGTEVFRRAMPTGAIDFTTKANKRSEGAMESVFYLKDIPKTLLKNGVNIIAAEVHQYDSVSSDLTFDLELNNRTNVGNAPALACTGSGDTHISCFTSLLPTDQTDTVGIPASHAFQAIFSQGETYKNQAGTVPGNFDFTGYVPKNGSSTNGWLSVNHETNPGGVSMLDIRFDCNNGKWIVDSSRAVDFTGELVKTERNCSGGVTPWGTVITSEETMAAGDANNDGYEDVGWNVEIDPATKRVKEYGNGKREKLWAVGRVSHENVVVANDSMTLYYGEDDGSSNVFKFIADQKTNLSSGKLYVLKLNSGLVSNEPTSTVGTWVLVPNTTQADRNNTKALGASLGGTMFNGIEDVEISPLDGKIYFTAKGNSRTYRFTDNGTTVSNFETFVGGKNYRINTGSEIISEPWGTGNDNLTFDDRGNLWVLQDGSRNHVWMIRPNHTQASPKVELFMITPIGSEPTGMTFSPDYRYMFISIQSPANNALSQTDVTGASVKFNVSKTIVVARKETFVSGTANANFTIGGNTSQCLKGNSFNLTESVSGGTNLWKFGNGKTSTVANPTQSYTAAGNYNISLTKTTANGCSDVVSKPVTVLSTPVVPSITGPSVAQRGSTQNYSVANNAGSTYNWTVDNGTQVSGGNSNAISVTWGNQAIGDLKVVEVGSSTCQSDTAKWRVGLQNVGINDISAIDGLQVYPNPVSTELTIKSTNELAYEVVDINGRVVLSGTKPATVNYLVNVDGLTNGVYILRLNDAGTLVNLQFIKN